ncbi:MAG TPA: hypothetical protein VGE35_04365 [Candidatus Paceibacterota bacterium]
MNILIVESNPHIVEMLRPFLEQACSVASHEILHAASIQEIGRIIVTEAGIDLVLCANRLHKAPVGDLLQTLHTAWPNALLCLMSDDHVAPQNHAADIFVEKVELVKELPEIVDAAKRRMAK